jgi:hypothetical protein
MRDEERGRRLIAVFLLGLVLFNFPLLRILDVEWSIAGLPPLVLYLFGTWALIILLLGVTLGRQRR